MWAGKGVDCTISERWERGQAKELVSGGLKWFQDLTDRKKKSDSSFRNEESEKEVKGLKGRARSDGFVTNKNGASKERTDEEAATEGDKSRIS